MTIKELVMNQVNKAMGVGITQDNNPFAIYSNPKTDLFFGVNGVRERENREPLLQFNNMVNGLRAGFYVLGKQYNGLTVDEIGQKYSRTDKTGYTNYLKQKLGKDFVLNADDNQSLIKLGTSIIGFETGHKDEVLDKLNISDNQILQAIKESKEERPNSVYSQMKNSGMVK